MIAVLLGVLVASAAEDPVCPPGTVLVGERRTETATAIYVQPVCERLEDQPKPRVRPGLYASGFTTEEHFANASLDYARANGWSKAELARLRAALDSLRSFTDSEEGAATRALWQQLDKRATDPAIRRAAAAAKGPDMLSAGWQSGKFSDCVVFAIATATKQPYGLVAARTNEMIRGVPWRSAAYRGNPELVFSVGGGLNDYEVALMAEAFGQVAAVEPADYAAQLRSGHAIVLPIATRGGSAHQVVLSGTFRHQGADWFTVIDSTRNDRAERLYLSAAELDSIALTKGLRVDAAPGQTVPLLRKP